VLAAACATSAPVALIDARRAYASASAGLAASLTPTELEDARSVLERANREYQEHGDTQLARDFAYIARRKVDLATSEARTIVDRELIAEAGREGVAQPLAAGVQLEVETHGPAAILPVEELQDFEEGERPQPPAGAPEGLTGTMREIAAVEKVREDGRGVIITLLEGELFGAGRTELTQAARDRLDKVAEALRAQTWDNHIVVEGHTDDLGTDDSLRALSVARANAVRDYLIGAGVETRKISAVGRGGSRPAVDNTSAENRAHNRRVEIVIQPGSLSQRF
jgi:outer membrane protein OmpA-like peptidoglycan-associated protein